MLTRDKCAIPRVVNGACLHQAAGPGSEEIEEQRNTARAARLKISVRYCTGKTKRCLKTGTELDGRWIVLLTMVLAGQSMAVADASTVRRVVLRLATLSSESRNIGKAKRKGQRK